MLDARLFVDDAYESVQYWKFLRISIAARVSIAYLFVNTNVMTSHWPAQMCSHIQIRVGGNCNNRIWGYHRGGLYEFRLLSYNSVKFIGISADVSEEYVTCTFSVEDKLCRGSCVCYVIHVYFILDLFLNVERFSTDCTALYYWKQNSSVWQFFRYNAWPPEVIREFSRENTLADCI
jgi:hypothetical protein